MRAGCGCWRRAEIGAAELCWVCCDAGCAPARGAGAYGERNQRISLNLRAVGRICGSQARMPRDPGMRLEHRGLPETMGAVEESLPLAVLDFVGIEYGESAHSAIDGAIRIAQAVGASGLPALLGLRAPQHDRAWPAVRPEILTAHVGALTERIRVGAAGIMLPNHAAAEGRRDVPDPAGHVPGPYRSRAGPGPGHRSAHGPRPAAWHRHRPRRRVSAAGRPSCWPSSVTVSRRAPVPATRRRAGGRGAAAAFHARLESLRAEASPRSTE